MKIIKRFVAALLIFSLFSTSALTNMGFGSLKEVKAANQKVSSEKTSNAKEKTKENSDEKNYEEGEAVVLYYASASGAKSLQKNFDANMTFEDTWNFQKKTASNQIVGNSTKMVPDKTMYVSKVTSTTYSTEELVQKLQKSSNIVYAEPNYIYHAETTGLDQLNGKYIDDQWSIENNGQNGGTVGLDTNVDDVWKTVDGTDKVIAVVDTGIDYTHEDLKDNMWENTHQDVLAGEHGYDFVNRDEDPMDDHGHGTHCAGIIAGEGDGIVGINATAKLMALKFLDETGSGDLADAVAAYDYIYKAILLGVDVVAVNNSWGGGEGRDIFQKVVDAVGEAGAVTVTAAGNNGQNTDNEGGDPWNFESDYKITVAATNEKGELAKFSNYGEKSADMAAPGVDILSSVSYNTYNPSIHEGDASYSEMYEDFDHNYDTSAWKSRTILGNQTETTIDLSSDEFFGEADGNNQSLHIHFDASDYTGKMVYVPIILPESTTDYFVSAMVKARLTDCWEEYGGDIYFGISPRSEVENGEDPSINAIGNGGVEAYANYWNMVSLDTGLTECSEEKDYVLWVGFDAYASGSYDIYIDNLGFSKANMEPEEFGKYDFYNGTSMAAPHVTGSVALLSELIPNLSADELREYVVSNSRYNAQLEGYVNGAKELDLSYNDVKPVLKHLVVKENNIEITGKFFGDNQGTVTLNGESVQVVSWNKDKVVINSNGVKNQYVSVEVTTADGNVTSIYDYAYYNEKEFIVGGSMEEYNGGIVASDGTYFYSLDLNGTFLKYDNGQWVPLASLTSQIFDSTSIVPSTTSLLYWSETQLVYANHKFYMIGTYDAGYYKTKKLVSYDIETDTWSGVANLNSDLEKLTLFTMTAYQDRLYVIGGIKESEGISNNVYTFDYKTDGAQFVKEDVTIPERFGAQAFVVNGKIIVTLGGDSKGDCPKNLIFDGNTWTQDEEAVILPCEPGYCYYINEDTELTYYKANVGLYQNGLIYTSLYTSNLGDVFSYNVVNHTYEKLPCSLYQFRNGWNVGTSVGDQYMFLADSLDPVVVEDWFGTYYYYPATCYSFDIPSGLYSVTGDATYATINGLGNYIPGESVNITVTPEDGYEIQSFVVNGQVVNGTSYTVKAMDQNYKVEVVATPCVESIEFEQENYQLNVGNAITLTPVFTPVDVANQKIVWSVSEEGVVSINEEGLITALATGEGKSVVVTATLASNESISASTTVTVPVQTILTSKIKLNKSKVTIVKGNSAQLVAQITPENATNQDVRWTSSDSSVAFVSNTGEVVGLKPGKATITATTKDGTKLSASCKVTVKPGKVRKLKTTQTTNSIRLQWTADTQVSGYTVYRYDNNKKAYSVVANLKSNAKSYTLKKLNGSTGKSLTSGTTYSLKVVAYKTIDGKKVYGEAVTLKATTKCEAPKIKSIKKTSSTKAKLTWSKVRGANGYEVYMSTKNTSSYKKIKTIKGQSNVTYHMSGLKKNTKYYVKVRAYKVVDGKKLYSTNSKVKSIKMK